MRRPKGSNLREPNWTSLTGFGPQTRFPALHLHEFVRVTDNFAGMLCPVLSPVQSEEGTRGQDLMPLFWGETSGADRAAPHRAPPAAGPSQTRWSSPLHTCDRARRAA